MAAMPRGYQHKLNAMSECGRPRTGPRALIVGTALIEKRGYEFPTWADRPQAPSTAPKGCVTNGAERLLNAE